MSLPRPFHDVDEPFKFVRRVLEDELRSRAATLRPHLREEAEGFLLEVLVRLSQRYDPLGTAAAQAVRARVAARVATRAEWAALHRYGRARERAAGIAAKSRFPGSDFAALIRDLGIEVGRTSAFSTWAYRILRRRYTDFLRDERGDRRYGNDGREVFVAESPMEGACEDAETIEALIASIDHDKLSPAARGALKRLVLYMVRDGLTLTQAAKRIGKKRREATVALDQLRRELQAAA